MNSRTIVLTGATRGLGRALAERFADAGHIVIGCGRSPAGVERVAAGLGAPHAFDAVDVSDDAAVANWARSAIERHGAPDLLLNNAGRINRNARLWEVRADEFVAVVGANLLGPANVLRHFLPAMIERGRGVVVNFSSTWGSTVAPEVAPYCATKWAIEGLTRALAQELPGGLAAVAFNPGVIHTEMLESCFGDAARGYPSPAEWASKAAPFLLDLGPRDNGRSVTPR